MHRTALLTFGCSFALANPAFAQVEAPEQEEVIDLLDRDLEDLLVLKSTSVAKKRQNVRDSAAAVYVITQEEIRNSAGSTIPDLLRAVPGVEVGHIANGTTGVSIRGFNGRNSNSLLVMVDGRSTYVSTLSGVFWDQINIPLQDLERIEVVRGPGATLWGANAVNGVINIITKNSADTLGLQGNARLGLREQVVDLSYGGQLGADATIRLNGQFRRNEGLQDATGNDVGTVGLNGAIGARLDWQPTDQDAITLQADFKTGSRETTTFNTDPALVDPTPIPALTDLDYDEINVLGRWRREQSEKLDFSLQAYYTRIDREEFGFFEFDWSIADIDFGANWRPNDTHDINFGVNLRAMSDDFVLVNPRVGFLDTEETDYWISGYLQDDISLIEDELRLTLGAKLEYNDFTGVEFQPGARLFYRPSDDFAVWGAASRAVRTPSRFERAADFQFFALRANTPLNPGPLPIFAGFIGDPDAEAEDLIALEAGFRADLGKGWNLDVAGFYNIYDNLAEPTVISAQPNFIPNVPFPVSISTTAQFQFRGDADTWGLEAVVKGEVTAWWKTQVSYSHFQGSVGDDPITGAPFNGFLPLSGSPENVAAMTNTFQIGSSVTLNTQLRYVDSLLDGAVPSYFDGDLRLRYEAPNGLDISLIGENLLEKRRLEFLFVSYPAPPSFNPRNVALELRYRF